MQEVNSALKRKIDQIKSNIAVIHNKFESLLKASQPGQELVNHYNHLWSSPAQPEENTTQVVQVSFHPPGFFLALQLLQR